jgi:hypothetical protein
MAPQVYAYGQCAHLLKLVTGVDTSTRPVSRSGRAGKTVDSDRRTAAAAPKSSSFCWKDMAAVVLLNMQHRRHGKLQVQWASWSSALVPSMSTTRDRARPLSSETLLAPAGRRQNRRISNFFVPPKVRPEHQSQCIEAIQPSQWPVDPRRRVRCSS